MKINLKTNKIMKNIHILKTDKPSRLFRSFGKLNIGDYITERENTHIKNQNVYITSDEEIKEGDWFLEKAGRQYPIQWNGIGKLNFHCKKIILTTDQDLIKDGVQAIDDEFLEWFVKNPSCEEIEAVNMLQTRHGTEWYDLPNQSQGREAESIYRYIYKIIIPKKNLNKI